MEMRSCLIIPLLAILVAGTSAFTRRYIDGEYIISLKKDVVRTDSDEASFVQLLADQYNINLIKSFHFNDLRVLYVQGKAEHIAIVRNLAHVKDAEQNEYGYGQQTCLSLPAARTWGLDRTDQREQLPYTNPDDSSATYTHGADTGTDVVAYICDSGVEFQNPQFEGRASWGYTADGMDGDADLNGHGTHCAGTVGSRSYGIAKNVTLVAVKVLLADNSGPWASIIDGLQWILEDHNNRKAANGGQNVKSVINFSIGGGGYQPLDDVVREIINAGIIIVISAMNENEDACDWSPARVTEALTIGASDVQDSSASFSNYGTCVDLFAPGVDVLSTYPGESTTLMSGTSMAAPHVAGVVARYMSAQATAPDPQQVASFLLDQATRDALTWGRPQHDSSPNLLLYAQCDL